MKSRVLMAKVKPTDFSTKKKKKNSAKISLHQLKHPKIEHINPIINMQIF